MPFLALTPAELPALKGRRLPLVHVAYAVGANGMLARSALPAALRGGLMGLSDRGPKRLGSVDALVRAITAECAARRFGGVWADFDGPPRPDRRELLARLAAALGKSGRQLYVPAPYAVPDAVVLIGTAISGGTLRELLSEAKLRFGAQNLALDCQRLAMDFSLPCRSGEGTALSRDEFAALHARYGSPSFFSEELCANYFTYHDGARAHFVLFDTAQTLRRKLRMGQECGVRTAFFLYPEVSDLWEELFQG